MRAISRRLNNIEKKLNLDQEQIVVVIKTYGNKEGLDLSNPAEQWLTYPEAVEKSCEQNGIIVLSESKEIAARKGQGNE